MISHSTRAPAILNQFSTVLYPRCRQVILLLPLWINCMLYPTKGCPTFYPVCA
ncbi:hypothetical protein SeF3a_215 [Salmonella phage SeF3a]|nr:hypothetical protein SeF3a_215 [Salmonella phage SeF3a]